MNLVYDTNIFIYYLKDELDIEKSSIFHESFLIKHNVYISAITRIELLSFSKLTTESTGLIESLLNEFQIIPLNRKLEDLTIGIRKDTGLRIPDAIIVATSILTKSTLITNDQSLINSYKEAEIVSLEDIKQLF